MKEDNNMRALKEEYKKGLFNGYTYIYIGIMGELQPLECIEYDEFEEKIKKDPEDQSH